MSRPKFFADQNLHGEIVNALLRREPAFPIIQARDVGRDTWSDEEILERSANDGEIVITHDFKTMIAHALNRIQSGKLMPGLFVVGQNPNIGKVADHLILVWACSEGEEWNNQIVFLPFKEPTRA